jgi:hypothetical protein
MFDPDLYLSSSSTTDWTEGGGGWRGQGGPAAFCSMWGGVTSVKRRREWTYNKKNRIGAVVKGRDGGLEGA